MTPVIKKRRAGRPALSHSGTKSVQVLTRFAPEDLARLEAAAKLEYRTASGYIRSCVLMRMDAEHGKKSR